MEPEDFLQPEVAIAALVAAAIFSPRARRAIRKGIVYTTAGAFITIPNLNAACFVLCAD